MNACIEDFGRWQIRVTPVLLSICVVAQFRQRKYISDKQANDLWFIIAALSLIDEKEDISCSLFWLR